MKKQTTLTAGAVIRITGDISKHTLTIGKCYLVQRVYLSGIFVIPARYVNENDYEIVELANKQTLKRFTKYLILEYLKVVITLKGCEFSGLDLAKHVKTETGRPDTYPTTIRKYLWQLSRDIKLGYNCTSRQKSMYKLIWVSTVFNIFDI